MTGRYDIIRCEGSSEVDSCDVEDVRRIAMRRIAMRRIAVRRIAARRASNCDTGASE